MHKVLKIITALFCKKRSQKFVWVSKHHKYAGFFSNFCQLTLSEIKGCAHGLENCPVFDTREHTSFC